MKANKIFDEDWKYLTSFLPAGWTAQAKKTKAFSRQREIKSVRILLRVLMLHIANGFSLRETVAHAAAGKLCNISDVAFHKRLGKSGEWLKWMSQELLSRRHLKVHRPYWLKGRRIRSIDGSSISEPGSRGTDWRIHYSIDMYDLTCNEFLVTEPSRGESFTNFQVEPGDIFLGDRAYGRLKSMLHITNHQGDFVTRIKKDAFQMRANGKPFDLLKNCSRLKYGDYGDWEIEGFSASGLCQKMRICTIRKSEAQIEKSVKKLKRNASKKGYKVTTGSLEFCKYFIIATSLSVKIDAKKVLKLYRQRWQVEIAFKRLKSILGIGALPKKDPETSYAWLYGKMFLSLLIEEMIEEGRSFSPWGYPAGRRN